MCSYRAWRHLKTPFSQRGCNFKSLCSILLIVTWPEPSFSLFRTYVANKNGRYIWHILFHCIRLYEERDEKYLQNNVRYNGLMVWYITWFSLPGCLFNYAWLEKLRCREELDIFKDWAFIRPTPNDITIYSSLHGAQVYSLLLAENNITNTPVSLRHVIGSLHCIYRYKIFG